MKLTLARSWEETRADLTYKDRERFMKHFRLLWARSKHPVDDETMAGALLDGATCWSAAKAVISGSSTPSSRFRRAERILAEMQQFFGFSHADQLLPVAMGAGILEAGTLAEAEEFLREARRLGWEMKVQFQPK
jgi:hypothetical protein